MDNNGANKKAVAVQEADKKKAAWKQWGILGAIIAIIALGGYFLGNGTAKAPADSTADEAALESAAADTNGEAPSFSWSFTPAGGDGTTGAPLVQVTLLVDGVAKDVGTYPGACSIVGTTDAWTPLVAELTGVICSWDGDGTELGVFFEAGTYVLKKGVLTEGGEGAASTRDSFTIVETL